MRAHNKLLFKTFAFINNHIKKLKVVKMLNSWNKIKKTGNYHRAVAKERDAILKKACEYTSEMKQNRAALGTRSQLPTVTINTNVYQQHHQFVSNQYIAPYAGISTAPPSSTKSSAVSNFIVPIIESGTINSACLGVFSNFFIFVCVSRLYSACVCSLISENIDGISSPNYDIGAENCEDNSTFDADDKFCDEEDETEMEKDFKLRSNLRKWAMKYQIPHVAVKDLMNLINTRIDKVLPEDPRTLLETPQVVSIVEIGDGGQYWHYGLECCLRRIFKNIDETKTISVNINMDGLPLFDSSKVEFWPILFNITEMTDVPAMPIGIFCGKTKCSNLHSFLTPFVDEMNDVVQNGIHINSHKITVRIRCIVCDSPARAYVKGMGIYT